MGVTAEKSVSCHVRVNIARLEFEDPSQLDILNKKVHLNHLHMHGNSLFQRELGIKVN